MRIGLIERLAYMWRTAENYYLLYNSGWQKDRLFRLQRKLNLTEGEIKELEDICWSMGI